MSDRLREAALEYHRTPTPGKISVVPTKAMATQRDLALAYSPGVADACLAIAQDPLQAAELTARSNLVAVVTNGTAVLGLGNIGPLAGKPVMEGKGCLFKKFAGIDVFDIELAETDPDAVVDTIARMEPTFGGINLEDIKAPECFYIEQKLRERMKIPVFHDDQHGTAIVAAAAVLNGLRLVGKNISEIKLVCSGAGAAALACLDLIASLGLKRENIRVTDGKGVVYVGRKEGMEANKARYAAETDARTLADVVPGADVFLGLSAAGVDMVKQMARDPLIFAMANPTPEIMPEDALAVRPDAIIGTGRSDYPDQINNVLCFPFIFRGALDCEATTINEAMKLATVHALAELARAEISEAVALAYKGAGLRFGREYLIPKPFDPRLIEIVAPAVAKAAAESGVATRPIADMEAYRQKLSRFVYHSGNAMQPVFAAARTWLRSVIFAEGEDERVLRAASQTRTSRSPYCLADRRRSRRGSSNLGVVFRPARPATSSIRKMPRSTRARRPLTMRERSATPFPRRSRSRRCEAKARCLRLRCLRQASATRCSAELSGRLPKHIATVRDVIGMRHGVRTLAVMQMLMLDQHQLFICDTHVNPNPTADQVADIAMLAAEGVRRFGLEPRVALLSHSSFGSSGSPYAEKMRQAREIVHERAPDLAIEGEMRGDAALS